MEDSRDWKNKQTKTIVTQKKWINNPLIIMEIYKNTPSILNKYY